MTDASQTCVTPAVIPAAVIPGVTPGSAVATLNLWGPNACHG